MGKIVVPNPEYALAMIVRDCAEDLDRCLASFAEFPDELVIVNTGIGPDEKGFAETNAVAEKYGAKVFHFPWIEDFSAARNFSFKCCTKDFVMWLDSDDTVQNPELMDKNIRIALSEGCDILYIEYLYEFDDFGNCTSMQKRERVVARKSFEWRAPIHECLCALRNVSPATLPPEIGRVIHNRRQEDEERQRHSQRRNLKVFRTQFEDKGIEPELRMLFYWGNTLMGLGDRAEAAKKYERYLERSITEGNGNDAEIVQACVGLSEAYCLLGRLDDSERVSLFAVGKMPHVPTPYLCLARVAVERKDWTRVAGFARRTLECQEGMDSQLVSNPRELTGRPYWFMAMAAAFVGELDAALQHADQAAKWFSNNPIFKEFHFHLKASRKRNDLLKAWALFRDSLIAEGRVSELANIAPHVPKAISDERELHGYLPKSRPNDKPTIAILCPGHPSIGPWGPWSILTRGIGGSEEAVINMSRCLAAKGWHVEVYANTGFPCNKGPVTDEVSGALWYRDSAWAGARDNPIDVAVSWRSPPAFRVLGCNAKHKYLWLHDVPNPAAWGAGLEEEYDGIFVLSKYHRSLFSFVRSGMINSENGLDPDLFVPLDDLTNDPHKLVWGSDPSRGLQYLLPWWGMIREAIPDATLDIYYGWTKLFLDGMQSDAGMKAAHDAIEKLRHQPGITWHGMVDQQKLAAAYAGAGFWPYMTTFPEIHCITALKAQAHGCWPVTVDAFALAETVQYGDKLPGPMHDELRQRAMVERLIERMKNPPTKDQRLEMARWARSKTWESVASQWDSLFRERLSLPTTAPSQSLSPSSTPS